MAGATGVVVVLDALAALEAVRLPVSRGSGLEKCGFCLSLMRPWTPTVYFPSLQHMVFDAADVLGTKDNRALLRTLVRPLR